MNSSFFGDMLQTIADRGRALLAGRNRRVSGEARTATLIERCEDLLSGRGEASGTALAREILIDFQRLKTGERVAFFEALSNVFGPDRDKLRDACEA